MTRLVGRKEEQRLLKKLLDSPNAEFLAVYGRRRIGKTFLINEFFKGKGIFFEVTGSPNASTPEQLLDYHEEYCALFKPEDSLRPPKTWSEALRRLAKTCKEYSDAKRIVIFFDELPWLASPRSGFLSALSYFWNRHASRMPNVLLIVCGSAASWMISKVINDRGGLHGRLSAQIRLLPFTLSETAEYLHERRIQLPHRDICELYMAIGGVPKYLSYLDRGQSAAQMINALCFSPQAPLLTEFHRLYASLFDQSQRHVAIIQSLAEATRNGLSRNELLDKLASGGSLSSLLRELEESGFISAQFPIGKRSSHQLLRINDEYSLFYLRWIDQNKSQLLRNTEPDFWSTRHRTPGWYNWAGHAFEALCLKHVPEIKSALGIGGVVTTQGHWQHHPSSKAGGDGAEIDLVIDRDDNCINLCEIKFSEKEFSVTRKVAEELERKRRVFREQTGSRKALVTTLITPYGLIESDSSGRVVDKSITIESLFSRGRGR